MPLKKYGSARKEVIADQLKKIKHLRRMQGRVSQKLKLKGLARNGLGAADCRANERINAAGQVCPIQFGYRIAMASPEDRVNIKKELEDTSLLGIKFDYSLINETFLGNAEVDPKIYLYCISALMSIIEMIPARPVDERKQIDPKICRAMINPSDLQKFPPKIIRNLDNSGSINVNQAMASFGYQGNTLQSLIKGIARQWLKVAIEDPNQWKLYSTSLFPQRGHRKFPPHLTNAPCSLIVDVIVVEDAENTPRLADTIYTLFRDHIGSLFNQARVRKRNERGMKQEPSAENSHE
ncbi:unnamed protein product [Caenorhabditis sp. 36 PRJEB53466]|nr:unnamed protein product [Caenorhabditis sp. 36 PRJEB53466]